MSKKKDSKKEAPQEEPIEEETVTIETEEPTVTVEESETEKLKKEIESKQANYMRLAAEYDNYRKRTTAEKAGIYGDAIAKTISEILPVADSLDMAIKSAENAPEEYRKGLELTVNQLTASLKKLNVEAFGETGDLFDPNIHNAVSKIENEELGENTVAAVFQKGYKTGDKVIRHAMVQVANCD